MFSISTSTSNLSVRCKVAGLLFVGVFLAVGFATGAQAQILQHGVSISKACQGPVRTCDTDEDCADSDLCTIEVCNLSIPDTLYCEYEVGYNDDYNDTVTIVEAFDVVEPAGDAVRSPAAGDAEIIFVSGNTNCTVGGALPCFIGPDLGGGAGAVTFVEDLYEPTAADPSPLPDQANIRVQDGCDGDEDAQCNPNTISLVQFPAQTNLVSGCEFDRETTCDDGDECTTESCNSTTGLCETTSTVTCDDGDACTTESCNSATGQCETTSTTTCDDGDACTTESCNTTSGECETTSTVTCDDGDACTTESCNTTSGECETTSTTTCDDGNECTDDSCNSETGECEYVDNGTCGVAICRTPGFWATHAGEEKNRSQNITQAVLDSVGGVNVCGVLITNTVELDEFSSTQAMCVAVKGVSERQLVRQLTAAALNCVMSGGDSDCVGGPIEDLFADCNAACLGDPSDHSINECIGEIDCFNNGGYWAGGSCTFNPGICEISGEICDADGEEQCTSELGDVCLPDPQENCHERELCQVDESGEPIPDGLCFVPPGPAGSSGDCNIAKKDDIYVGAY